MQILNRTNMKPKELVAYLRANPTSDAMGLAADMIESLELQNTELTDIVRHQAALNEAAHAEIGRLREALKFYADGKHFIRHDDSAWDTVSGEPQNLYEDESNTATVEDGTFARAALNQATSP